MGQKTHPVGFRLGVVKNWQSRWYAGREMPALLKEDDLIRKYLKQRLGHAAIAQVDVERRPGKVTVTVHTGRPGVVIRGITQRRRGRGVEDCEISICVALVRDDTIPFSANPAPLRDAVCRSFGRIGTIGTTQCSNTNSR